MFSPHIIASFPEKEHCMMSILGSHHLTGCHRWQESSLGNKPCVAFILMEDHRLGRREHAGDDRRFCNWSSAWCVTKEILIPINNIWYVTHKHISQKVTLCESSRGPAFHWLVLDHRPNFDDDLENSSWHIKTWLIPTPPPILWEKGTNDQSILLHQLARGTLFGLSARGLYVEEDLEQQMSVASFPQQFGNFHKERRIQEVSTTVAFSRKLFVGKFYSFQIIPSPNNIVVDLNGAPK